RRRVAGRPPGEGLFFHERLEGCGVRVTEGGADDREGLARGLLEERALVGAQGPAGASGPVPEIKQHHLAAVVAQLEPLAVLVLALNLGGNLADGKVQEIVQSHLGLAPNRTADRYFHIAELVGGSTEQFLTLRSSLGSSCLANGG